MHKYRVVFFSEGLSLKKFIQTNSVIVNYVQGVQVIRLLMFCVIFSILKTDFQKWRVIQLPMKLHNRFTTSSFILSLGCLSAVFRVNDPVLAVTPGYLRQTDALRHLQSASGHFSMKTFIPTFIYLYHFIGNRMIPHFRKFDVWYL